MLDLSTISFKVETSELDRAGKAIGELVTNVGKLDKAARDAAQTEVVLAKAAKLNADANLQNAKAQDVRLKSTITADKADQQAAAAIERKTKATERASTAIKKNADMLQLQNDTYDFILEGFSKGDAKVLAMAKATGQLSDQLKQVLTDIRQFSKNTFDQTETGLDRMVKSAKEASSAQGFLNNGLNLTSKQAKELSNDLDRLNIRLQHQGKSYQEITKEQAIYKQRFVEEANAVNRATSALAAVDKQRKDVVSATNYLTQAEAKMAAALNTSNVALDKAGTDSLVKYEAALRKSGISQDAATAKLATYKAQLTQVAGLEEKRRAQHLARALQPQFTDIAVSLYSGQSPLTVLLQQSGQMVDLFKLSGIEADNLGKVMREAFASMIPAIATVAKGLTSLVFESFMSAGSAVTRFVGNVTGITAAMEIAKRAIVSGGEANFKYIASLDKIGKTFSAVAATGIAAMIAGMILLGLEYKKIIQAEAELTNALATSGGALGISKTEAIAAAEGMTSLGVGTLKAVAAITEIAKAGNIGKESLELITKSAIDLEKTAGISIEETAKQFAKLQEEPAKALTEIAQKTGLVDKSTLDYVYALEQQGDKTEAARVATLALASANAQVAAEVRDNWSPIEVLWNDIKSAIGSVKQEIYDLTTSNAVVGALRTVWETVAVVISEVWFTIKGVGKEIGGIGAQIAAVMQGDFSGAAEIGRMMKADATSAAEEQEKYIEAILNRTSVEQTSFNQSKAQNSQYAKWRRENDQALDKSISKTDKYKAKELEMQKAVLAGTVSQIEADKALAGWKKIILGEEKTKKDPSENYFATLMREATSSSIKAEDATKSLTASQVKLLEAVNDPRFLELSKVEQEAYLSTMAANVGKEQQIALTNAQADAEERLLSLLGKSSGIGRQYYTDMANMEKDAALLGKSREEIEELTRAVFMATPAWKAYEKALEDVNSAARKFNEDSIASQAATLKENKSLDYRISLLGKTAEEQKALSAEYNRANKISEVRIKLAKQLRDIEADIEKAKKNGLPESDYQSLIDAQVQARKDAAEQEKVINREVAVQYAEDLDKEIRAVKDGISDSIVTALFEGGKAGSKKLRNVIIAELKKPVTMVVNAVVNTLLGNILGSLMGGAAAGAAGGAAGGIAGSIGSSIAGSTIVSGIGMMGTEGLANIVGMLGGDSLGVLASGATGGFSSAIAAAIGQIPVWGWIAGGLAAIATMLDDSGTYHTGGAARYSNGGGLTSGNSGAAFDIGFGQVETGKETISAMEQLSKALVDIFDGIAKTFGKTAGYEVAVAFADDTSEDGAWGAFGVRLQGVEILNWEDFRQSKWAPKEFGDGEEGYKQYLAAIAKDTRKIILDMDLPGWADKILTDLGESASMEALSTAIQQIGVIKGVFDTMTNTLVELSGASDETLAALMTLSGGIEALRANATTYYQNFYSAEEQRANVQKQLAKSFKELGLSMIDIDATDARQQFRDLVEAQDLTTESGRKVYAALLAIAGTFASVTTAAAEVTDSIITVADALNELRNETRSVEDIARNILRLEQAVFEAQNSGNIEVLRNNILQGLTEQERVLQRQLWAIEDTRTAQDKLVSAYKSQVTALDSSINRLRTYSDSLKKFKDSLTLGELSPLTPSEQYAEAKRQYESNLALAMVGDVGAQNALQGSITAFLQASRTYNASSSQYTSDFNAAQAGLDFIASITQDQANNEQILRDAAVSQLELLGSIDESVTAVGELISSGLIELSNAILTGLSLGITPDQGVLDAVNNGLGGGQSSYYNSLHTTTKSQSNQPIAIIPVNQASAMQSDSQGLVSLNSQLVEEVRNLTAQVILLRSERQQDTRSQTQILATATTEAGTAVTEAINKSNYTQQVRTGATLN